MPRMRKDKDNPIDWGGFDPNQQQPKSHTAILAVCAVAVVVVAVVVFCAVGCAELASVFSQS